MATSSETKTIDIGLVCVGSLVSVPIVVCNNDPDNSVPDAFVTINEPNGLQFNSSNLARGTYNSVSKVWTVGTLGKAECVVGELIYTVINDTEPDYKFTYTVSTTSGCSTCKDSTGCVQLNGISCTEIQKCNPDITTSNTLVCDSGSSCLGNVSINDSACPASLTRTYQWIDTELANGTITGTPESYTYTPFGGIYGIGEATYGVYCGGILVDTGKVNFVVNRGFSPTGSITAFAGTTAPFGWLLCDGGALSRSDYSRLFNVIGTTFGAGDGSTTFGLPDLRGKFLLGLDNMGGSGANFVTDPQADILGGVSGDEEHTLTEAQLPAHNHEINLGDTAGLSTGSGNFIGDDTGSDTIFNATVDPGGTTLNSSSVSDTGSGEAHNNLPPFMSFNFIIKY